MNEIDVQEFSNGFIFDLIKYKAKNSLLSISTLNHNQTEITGHYLLVNNDNEQFEKTLKQLLELDCVKICFSSRELNNPSKVFDICTTHGSVESLTHLINNITDEAIVLYLEQKIKIESHIRAAKIVGVDFNLYSIQELIPSKVLRSFQRLKNEVMFVLYKQYIDKDWYFDHGVQWMSTLYEIERNGIAINEDIQFDKSPATIEWYSHIKNKQFLHAKFAPFKSKTGRAQIFKESFRCMNIPKSDVRQAVVSKFKGGKIASIDLNAADYRCLVASTQDTQLKSLYKDSIDFHSTTSQLVFGDTEQRDLIKKITYLSLYGSTVAGLKAATSLDDETLNDILNRLSFMRPIFIMKDALQTRLKLNGYIETFLGYRVRPENDHSILPLYGQAQTNDVFMNSLVKIQKLLHTYQTQILFVVHDEIVLDVHPNESGILQIIKNCLETNIGTILGMRMTSKVSVGENYYNLEVLND